MLIIISHPETLENEASLINHLFEAGMQLFHLRKPEATEEEVILLLKEIQPEYRKGVVLNQFYELSEEFGMHRFHFSTDKRKMGEHSAWKKEGNVLSTSTHSVDELMSLDDCFDYAFLSPVFDSISKPDYKAKSFELKPSEGIKRIALGGINEENCVELKEKGYDGIALLGAIWNSKNPVERFEKVTKKWSTTDQ